MYIISSLETYYNQAGMSATRSLTVFCTELAALAGRHRYRSKEAAIAQFLAHNESIIYDKYPHKRADIQAVRVKQAVERRAEFHCRKRNASLLEATIDSLDKSTSPEESRLVLDEQLATIENPAERDLIRSVVFRTRGVRTEPAVLEEYERLTGHVLASHDSEFRLSSLYTTPGGVTYRIGGRLDGVCDSLGRVVEVKSRMNKFFLPEYDIIQVYGYFAITGLTECDLIQTLCGELRTDSIEYEDAYWKDIKQSLERVLDSTMMEEKETGDHVVVVVDAE